MDNGRPGHGVIITCIVRLIYGGALQSDEVGAAAQKRDVAPYGPPTNSSEA